MMKVIRCSGGWIRQNPATAPTSTEFWRIQLLLLYRRLVARTRPVLPSISSPSFSLAST